MVSVEHYFFLSVTLFLLGVVGVLLRRNVTVVLMSIELILTAVNINLAAFSHFFRDPAGQVFAILIVVVATTEAGVGLAIIRVFFRGRESKPADEKDLFSW
jgi:NADH-quinone oxidoreductase subunit K